MVRNGPELMTDLVAEFVVQEHLTHQKHRQILFHLANEYEKNVVLSEASSSLGFRNQAKLQDYQREYARRKRAPGHRKVSKAKRQLLEEHYVKKQSLMEMEGLSQAPGAALSQGYICALIVRSQAVDPQRTASMTEKEEKARQHFEELKCILPELSPRGWKKLFKHYVDKYIEERLFEKEVVTGIRPESEEEKEEDRILLHGLRRLVACAVQEWELVQQPKHAAACAKLDRALVWQGRGVNMKKFRQLYGW